MFKDKEKHFELYAMKLQGLENGPALAGEVVTDARSDVDPQKGGWEVTMYMNSQGARQWEDITAEAAPATSSPAAGGLESPPASRATGQPPIAPSHSYQAQR